MVRFALFLSALSLIVMPGGLVHAADGSDVVYCYDTSRSLVKRVRQRHCDGEVVTHARAAQIHAEIEADRRSRQNRMLAQSEVRSRVGIRFKSAGAAFAVNHTGELLTSAHVVRGCDLLEVRRNDRETTYPARVKAHLDASDLAVIRIAAQTPDILRFAARRPEDGSPLALIGYPSEGMIRRTPRMTPVLTSYAISNPATYGLLGIAGDVRRGNSGGPALNSRGRAVGVLKAKINTVAAHKLTGRVLRDLGVVVENARVLQFLKASQTRYTIDGTAAPEMTGRDLFNQGSRAVYRVDCLVRE